MFVVCHMLASLDGKIDGAFFGCPEAAPALEAYSSLREFYHCQAVLYGTTTMRGGFADGPAPAADGGTTAVSSFEKADFLPDHGPVLFHLREAKVLDQDVLWLRYGRRHEKENA